MAWKVPLSDLAYDDREEQAVVEVVRSRWLSMGPRTAEFEKAFCELTGAAHAFATSNCTVGLHLALAALGLGAGDEVIVPSLTFVATVNTVLATGATPVFADIESLDSWLLSAETIEKRITPATRAVSVVHYAGYPADMTAIAELCKARDLLLIEDCAHSPGATWAGTHTGRFGQFGAFSFFSNKNLATGEGGMLITDDDELAEKARLLRSHGMTTLTWQRHKGHAASYDVMAAGYNYRTDEIHSALGLVQLSKLQANNAKRGEHVAAYRRKLADVADVSAPFAGHPDVCSYHIFPVLLGERVDRPAVMAAMKHKGVQTSIHYPPVHTFSYMVGAEPSNGWDVPNTERVGLGVLTLPLFPDMTDAQVDLVVSTLKDAL